MPGYRAPTGEISESLRKDAPPIFDDIPAQIGYALGHREFFFQIGAQAIHRIGINRGLGWRLPFGEAKDHINFVKVELEKGRNTLRMSFGKGNRELGNTETPDFELIREVGGLKLDDIKKCYEENT